MLKYNLIVLVLGDSEGFFLPLGGTIMNRFHRLCLLCATLLTAVWLVSTWSTQIWLFAAVCLVVIFFVTLTTTKKIALNVVIITGCIVSVICELGVSTGDGLMNWAASRKRKMQPSQKATKSSRRPKQPQATSA